MNESVMKWMSPLALVVSVLTLVMVGSMFWTNWQQNNPDSVDINLTVVSRAENLSLGDPCAVNLKNDDNPISTWSHQVVVENARGETVGMTSLMSGGEVEDRSGSNYCVISLPLTVDRSDFYTFSLYGRQQRVMEVHPEESEVQIEIYADE